jgi:hypothetical protein
MMTEEAVRIWKEAVMTSFRYLSQERLRKTMENLKIVGVPAEIRTKYRLNTNPQRYDYTSCSVITTAKIEGKESVCQL